MNVLLVGSGGREHALAWKIAQSPRLRRFYIAPGNAGTAQHGENVAIQAENISELTRFAVEKAIDLVVVGPEGPLALGLTDLLVKAGVKVFGPSQAAAQIEASKAFAKSFMVRHNLPTARYAVFTQYDSAIQYLNTIDDQIVIKASGLAAGKGVIVPESLEECKAALHSILVEGELGSAGSEVIIEERLTGEEISLLAFTDGQTLAIMPPSQDHKRLLDSDRGLNTGGMGAYAPMPLCTPQSTVEIERTILQPAIDGLSSEGSPFVGVLYAGLMLTQDGPSLLEFNCRFGDPETQAILPLLESDLLDIMDACASGRLNEVDVRWHPGAAACVVLASAGYPARPQTGQVIRGLERASQQALVFHAGTRRRDGQLLTSGGRVLGITGCGPNLEQALQRAYQAVDLVEYEGMQFRTDIGQKALARHSNHVSNKGSAYSSAGVNIDAGNRAVELMSAAVRSTYGPEVLAGIGAFGGLFHADFLRAMQDPVLVASIDGVGTKVKLAAQAGRNQSIGHDLVNHCINDILVQGARPLFFLDYIASAKIDPASVAEIVTGISDACRAAGCALIGGETAEMPGVYVASEFDVAGAIIGVVERRQMLPSPAIQSGDLLLGLSSSGPHTNGFSLIRKIFASIPLDTVYQELSVPLADALLAPHRSYLPILYPLVSMSNSPVKALAHLTGGGLFENIPRILPADLCAAIQLGSWPIPPLFTLIQKLGEVSRDEMYRVFNMGLGIVAVISPEHVHRVQDAIPEKTFIVGQLTAGERGVRLYE